ncbi:hypothetical protein ACFFLM_26435 [Deinococcus oregonensis]|uniref:Uncharacterized protein n=1 Tax=Deinococcus oregonensis TaxID=1805970 RepID=A0ABV6B6S5_9DEIO
MEHLLLKTTALSLATVLLAGCGQSPLTAAPAQTPAASSSPAPAGGNSFGLLTPAQAAARLQERDLQLQVGPAAPAWTAGLQDAQGRFLSGTLHAGVPIALSSPVTFSPLSTTAAEDTATLPELTRHLIDFGDAALIPLLLESGDTVGLLRLPLYPGAEVLSSTAEYVLFGQPTASIMTAQAAAVAAGTPDARALALALNADGQYDPFNFRWLVAPATKGGRPTWVSPGLPTLITQRGEQIPAAVGREPLSSARPEVSAAQASGAAATYAPEVFPTRVRAFRTQQ